MIKKTLAVLTVFIGLLFFTGCDNCDSSDQSDTGTVTLNEGLELKMDNSSPMYYSLELGPFDVSAYEQIRIITSIYYGAGPVHVSISEVNETGEIIATLDKFDLNAETYTAVYEVPGERIRISYSSTAPNPEGFSKEKYINCIVYAR